MTLKFMKDEWDEDGNWVANHNGIIVTVGNEYGHLKDANGDPTYEVTISLPHQCDNWDIAWGDISILTQVKSDFADFITDLQAVQTYLDSEEFKTFLEGLNA